MGGAYSYLKPQGFRPTDPRDEEVHSSTNSGSMGTVPPNPGFAMLVGACRRMALTDKTITDQVYDEPKQNEVMGEIKNQQLNYWRHAGTWWNDPSMEDFGKAVRTEFATKVVPYVKAKFGTWEAALKRDHGTTQGCNGPLVIEKVGLALLFGRASDQIRNLDGAAAALIFLGSGSEAAEALTVEQLKALERQLAR